MKILLGPAGSPAKSTAEGIKTVRGLGLHAMEVAFTHGIRMGNELAERIGEENEKFNVSLSIHAPYYINLNSQNNAIVKDSRARILQSCERGHHMGAKRVVFHAAYYGSASKQEVYETVKGHIFSIIDEIKSNGWDTEILPETMGRLSQFGELGELIQLSSDTKCGICIDPAHIYARNLGRIDYDEMFDKTSELRKKEIHFHFSGINFGPKGERNHLVLDHSPDFTPFAKQLIERKISCTIISESPVTWKDSLKMKSILEELGFRFGTKD